MKFFNKKDKEIATVNEAVEYAKKLEKRIADLEKETQRLDKKSKSAIRSVEITRFNPFSKVGGDQSFSLALLDDGNNGVVMTSLFGRDGNRVYAKPIKDGASEYALSGEEKNIIEKIKKNVKEA